MSSVRAALHVHSDWSYDGSWPLIRIARDFSVRGYDLVLMAEHDRSFDSRRWREYRRACARASERGALLVPGIEYSDPTETLHFPVWGVPFMGRGRDPLDLLDDVRARGGATLLAHPARRDAHRLLTDECLARLDGIEVWNRKYDGLGPSRRALELASTADLPPLFGLDFHTPRQFFPLALRLPRPGTGSAEEVAGYLKHGRCRPEAFGLPARRVLAGPAVWAACEAERARRTARAVVRRTALTTRRMGA